MSETKKTNNGFFAIVFAVLAALGACGKALFKNADNLGEHARGIFRNVLKVANKQQIHQEQKDKQNNIELSKKDNTIRTNEEELRRAILEECPKSQKETSEVQSSYYRNTWVINADKSILHYWDVEELLNKQDQHIRTNAVFEEILQEHQPEKTQKRQGLFLDVE